MCKREKALSLCFPPLFNSRHFGSAACVIAEEQEEYCSQIERIKLSVRQRARIETRDKARRLASRRKIKEDLDITKQQNPEGSINAYGFLLRHCGTAIALFEGRVVHAHIIRDGHHHDRFLGNLLIQMYGRCLNLDDAKNVFYNMHNWNQFSWNIMLTTYGHHRHVDDALRLYGMMRKSNLMSNAVSWNVIIWVLLENGQGQKAIQVFREMQAEHITPDKVTFLNILNACSDPTFFDEGKLIHAQIIGSDLHSIVCVANCLITMYGKCGRVEESARIFDLIVEKDIVSFSAMIAACASNGRCKDALQLFKQIREGGLNPNPVTFVSALDACGSLTDLKEGKALHNLISESGLELDTILGTALVNMYANSGSVEDARLAFEATPSKDVVAWTSMIAAYTQNGYGEEALLLFQQMMKNGVVPNKVTFISCLEACTNLGDVEEGKEIHRYIIDMGVESDIAVANALLNMYGSCGSLNEAWGIFDKIHMEDLIPWNTLISGYAQHGQGRDGLLLFQKMLEKGLMPDQFTFVSFLSACSHAGLLDEGNHYFISLCHMNSLTPTVEQYGCMVDLLGRAALLGPAEDMIDSMPFDCSVMPWTSLLSACGRYSNVEQAKRAAQHLINVDPGNPTPYVLLKNIFAAAGRWSDAAKLRKEMEEHCRVKQPSKKRENFIADMEVEERYAGL